MVLVGRLAVYQIAKKASTKTPINASSITALRARNAREMLVPLERITATVPIATLAPTVSVYVAIAISSSTREAPSARPSCRS